MIDKTIYLNESSQFLRSALVLKSPSSQTLPIGSFNSCLSFKLLFITIISLTQTKSTINYHRYVCLV